MRGRHVAKQRGWDVEATGRRIVDNPSLGNDDDAIAARAVEDSMHAVPLRRADQRTAIEVGERRPGPQRLEAGAEPLEQRLVGRRLDQQP